MRVILERLSDIDLVRDLCTAEGVEDDAGHECRDSPGKEDNGQRHDDASPLQRRYNNDENP